MGRYFCNVPLQGLGAGQTHLPVTGNFQPREGMESAAREGLGIAYGAIFNGLARTLGTTLKLQPA